MIDARLDTAVLARLATSAQPLSHAQLAKALRRFAPMTVAESDWAAQIAATADRVAGLDAKHELATRVGGTTWRDVAERRLPALALGVSSKDLKLLSGRDPWTAAIAGRLLGLWSEGSPPSLATVCDAYAWRAIGLGGRAKRCPPEIRAVFLQRELQVDVAAPDRLLRLYAARELGAPRSDAGVLRDAVVRTWLLGKPVGPTTFADEVRRIARAETIAVFGPHRVFISAVIDGLRRLPRWATRSVAELKAELLAARAAGQVELARADLVGAMDPERVAASQTDADGATFHFVVRGEHG